MYIFVVYCIIQGFSKRFSIITSIIVACVYQRNIWYTYHLSSETMRTLNRSWKTQGSLHPSRARVCDDRNVILLYYNIQYDIILYYRIQSDRFRFFIRKKTILWRKKTMSRCHCVITMSRTVDAARIRHRRQVRANDDNNWWSFAWYLT